MAKRATPADPVEVSFETAELHGRSVGYLGGGKGSVLLLIHGIAVSSEHWRPVLEPLAQRHTVIAPDLPGHGTSVGGAGDYSLGNLATGLRDLLLTLGHDRATLVGHSLGGGIAMQFAYQFPEMVERLVLVSSGGLGPEVSPVLRAAALPGADLFIAATAGAGEKVGNIVMRGLTAVGRKPGPDILEVARAYTALGERQRRKAFLSTLRSVVGTRGQRVSATDRLYLAEEVPVLIIWGARDPIIPVRHGEDAQRALPGSQMEVFEGAGHLPQLEQPAHFTAVLERFVSENEPARFDRDEWRARFKVA